MFQTANMLVRKDRKGFHFPQKFDNHPVNTHATNSKNRNRKCLF